MAPVQVLAALAIVATILPTTIFATEFIVGDDQGWSLKVNFTQWAMGKEFKVGDTLVFKYSADKHNVIQIGGPGFQSCNVSAGLGTLGTGNDVIPLASPGKKWYICGFPGHCDAGMKLVIKVSTPDEMGPGIAPAAQPPVSAGRVAAAVTSKLGIVFMAGVMAILF